MKTCDEHPARRPRTHLLRSGLVACAAVTAAVGISACGGSSKPAYCSARSNLETSIKGLSSLNLSSGVSGLKAQLGKIQSDANALLSSAKSDFPSQTSAIKTSVQSLEGAVKGLSSNPSATQIASVASDASAVVSAVKSFTGATSSKCG